MQRRTLPHRFLRCLLALAMLLAAAGVPAVPPDDRPAPARLSAIAGAEEPGGRERLKQRFQQLPPQQQQRLKELAREFKALPEADQQRLRRCWREAQRGAEVDCRELLP